MLIAPLRKRRFLTALAALAFIVLSIMLRFDSSFLELVDTAMAIVAQEIAQHFLYLAGPANFLGSLWVVWIVFIIWAFFLRFVGYKVGSWWSIAIATMYFLGMLVWSAIVFLTWNHGFVLDQTMPELALAMWGLLFFQMQNILVQRLKVARWVKKTIAAIFIIIWIILAGNKMVGTDLSFTTALGSFLIAFVAFRVSARMYLKYIKNWMVIFAVDGKM